MANRIEIPIWADSRYNSWLAFNAQSSSEVRDFNPDYHCYSLPHDATVLSREHMTQLGLRESAGNFAQFLAAGTDAPGIEALGLVIWTGQDGQKNLSLYPVIHLEEPIETEDPPTLTEAKRIIGVNFRSFKQATQLPENLVIEWPSILICSPAPTETFHYQRTRFDALGPESLFCADETRFTARINAPYLDRTGYPPALTLLSFAPVLK